MADPADPARRDVRRPRVIMPFVGRIGRQRTRCHEVAANGDEGAETAPAARGPA